MYLNVLYQDSTTTMKLEMNGRNNSGKRSRYFDIKLFYVSILVERKEVSIEYFSMDSMWEDFIIKTLIGN